MQLLLPLFPNETKLITPSLGVFKKDEIIYYIHCGVPIYSHIAEDIQSFRYITSKFITERLCRKIDVVNEEAKANVTDPESRIMKTRSGYVQGYNAQAIATEEQIIIAADVRQEENDVQQTHPMLDNVENTLKEARVEETIEAVVMDAGYFSESKINKKTEDKPELFIATKKEWRQRKELSQQDVYRASLKT
jgi:hypothetical protein